MKSTSVIATGLQEAINLELSLSLQYTLDARNLKRYGLKIAKGFGCLAGQSRDFAKQLTSRLLFLEGEPGFAPQPAKTHANVSDIIGDAVKAETAIVARYSALAKRAFDEGDMSNFHYYQHLAKWHREGDGKFKGHLAWLQKQEWQLGEFGETDYEEVKAQ